MAVSIDQLREKAKSWIGTTSASSVQRCGMVWNRKEPAAIALELLPTDLRPN